MQRLSKQTNEDTTVLKRASNLVCQAVAEFKADVTLDGDIQTLPWDQAFALAVVGSSVREVPDSTYTTVKFVFDSAQRISFAWYFEQNDISLALEALEHASLLKWRDNGLQLELTPKAERLLLTAGKALDGGHES